MTGGAGILAAGQLPNPGGIVRAAPPSLGSVYEERYYKAMAEKMKLAQQQVEKMKLAQQADILRGTKPV